MSTPVIGVVFKQRYEQFSVGFEILGIFLHAIMYGCSQIC